MLTIRPSTPQDAKLILQFIRELAEYEREPHQAVATEADILRDGFGPQPKFRCDLAFWDDQPAGFCFYFFNYSTWQGRPGLYLEDLFVRPEMRGKGIGKALLVHLAQVALKENCGRFVWAVLDWNTPAQEFYKSLGAKLLKEWWIMRVDGEELLRLATTPDNTNKQ